VTATTPGVSADSNGLFHGLGDHASNSFSVDGQSITDQQSKVFSNQIPSNSIQSIEVISGAPPAEYGGKTSLVIVATTRSGQGVTKPTGSISSPMARLVRRRRASICPMAARTGATF
jgi:outer membrane receptor protein involved in Fe transport